MLFQNRGIELKCICGSGEKGRWQIRDSCKVPQKLIHFRTSPSHVCDVHGGLEFSLGLWTLYTLFHCCFEDTIPPPSPQKKKNTRISPVNLCDLYPSSVRARQPPPCPTPFSLSLHSFTITAEVIEKCAKVERHPWPPTPLPPQR